MTISTIFARTSDPEGLLFLCGAGAIAGMILFFYGFHILKRRRLILDTPFSKIRSAALGMVEVSGLAVGPFTMVSPITQRPCYYYRTAVWEWKQHGKEKDWVKIADERMFVPFFVDDGTGRMIVDPRGADLEIHRDFEQQFNGSFFSSLDQAPGNVNAFLARHGIVTSNKIKVEEFCIKPKNALFVLGNLSENPGLEVSATPICDSEHMNAFSANGVTLQLFTTRGPSETSTGYPLADEVQQPHEIVHLSGGSEPAKTTLDMTQQQKIAAALAKAGISNPAAWRVAGVPMPGTDDRQVVSGSIAAVAEDEATPFDRRPPVVLMKGTSDKTFLISWRSQQDVARTLGWKSALFILGGPALFLLSAYFFLALRQLR